MGLRATNATAASCRGTVCAAGNLAPYHAHSRFAITKKVWFRVVIVPVKLQNYKSIGKVMYVDLLGTAEQQLHFSRLVMRHRTR